MSDGHGDGGDFGGGDFGHVHAGDGHFADFGPIDLGVHDHGGAFSLEHEAQAHTRHELPAHITFDFAPPSDVPLEAVVLSEPTTWSLHNIETRPNKVGFWRRLGRALILLNGG